MSSSGSESGVTGTLVLISFRPNNVYSLKLFQRVVEDTKQNYPVICQWYGMTIEKPRSLYWYIATDTTLSATPTSGLKNSLSSLTDEEPVAFAMTTHRALPPVLRSPITVIAIMDVADGQPDSVAEDMINHTADMQHKMPGFFAWTYGLTENRRRAVYMGGWESMEDHVDLASFGREEDTEFVQAAEETFSFFSAVRIRHVEFKEEATENFSE
ncbi:hypothetical protein PENSPDRAFT_647328 [Peniophora sp. CONT]|nr:hypothetical protein PENSPDRAFT_647328 [Peniophora sp. CONT]